MTRLPIIFFVALCAVAVLSAPEGTREKPAKITAADAMRTPKHHEEEAEAVHHVEAEEEAVPSAVHESKRLKRGILRRISDAVHGTAETKLVAIPITHGTKKVKKGSSAAVAGAGLLGTTGVLSSLPSLGAVPLIGAAVKVAKLAAPVVKPVVLTVHFAGKAIGHKVHTVGKIVDHKTAIVGHFL